MSELTYTVIKSKDQYFEYCNRVEVLVKSPKVEEYEEEIKLLLLLIRDYDEQHKTLPDMDPVQFIVSLKKDHGLSQNDLAEIAGVTKSYISEILNYKKGLSKNVIPRLADHFKIQQSALNKEYRLDNATKPELVDS